MSEVSDLKEDARNIEKVIADLRAKKVEFAKQYPANPEALAVFDIRIKQFVAELAEIHAKIAELENGL